MVTSRVDAPAAQVGLRALWCSAGFPRLWAIGACANTMRWFEVLAAALFTLEVTGSGFAVAVVSAARTLPMLLLGAFAGVASEAVNRKHVLFAGQVLAGLAAAAVAALAWAEWLEPWHLATAALAAGIVWSTEMATRRRMVGECVAAPLVARALALDAMTNSLTRLVGPITAGALYQRYGIAGAFTLSTLVYVLSAAIVLGLPHRQEVRRFVLSHVPRDLGEGLRFARGHLIIAGVLAVTFAMNLLGFPYSALLAPVGKQVFHVSDTLVGVLAAAEAFGAFLGGLWLSTREPRWSGRVLMVGGSLVFLTCVFLMPRAPAFPIAVLLLVAGGFGSAAFANMQTALVVLHAPPAIRSRLMGLLTVCIGMGPVGILLVGALGSGIGPLHAIDVVSASGFLLVAVIGLVWRGRDRGAARLAQGRGSNAGTAAGASASTSAPAVRSSASPP